MASTTPRRFRPSARKLRSAWDPTTPICTRAPNGPCHYRAIHSSPYRSSADNHGQRQGALDQRRSVPSQVAAPPDLALQSGGRPRPGLHRTRRARPADRSLVAEDRSAEGVRDRTGPEHPMFTRLHAGRAATPRDERVQDGTTRSHPPSSKAWWRPGEDQPAHRVGNLGPGVLSPAVARSQAAAPDDSYASSICSVAGDLGTCVRLTLVTSSVRLCNEEGGCRTLPPWCGLSFARLTGGVRW
jgi:hypothetical protein